jgi:hypothetical protein
MRERMGTIVAIGLGIVLVAVCVGFALVRAA